MPEKCLKIIKQTVYHFISNSFSTCTFNLQNGKMVINPRCDAMRKWVFRTSTTIYMYSSSFPQWNIKTSSFSDLFWLQDGWMMIYNETSFMTIHENKVLYTVHGTNTMHRWNHILAFLITEVKCLKLNITFLKAPIWRRLLWTNDNYCKESESIGMYVCVYIYIYIYI